MHLLGCEDEGAQEILEAKPDPEEVGVGDSRLYGGDSSE
jgi:hypothetical protein